MRSPIFIIGGSRSGTTLIRLMLTCHRNIMIPPECGFAVWWYQKYKEWRKARLPEFLQDLMQSRKIDTWEIDEEDLSKFLRERDPPSYSQLISSIYEWYGSSRERSFERWGDKNNFHIRHILTIKEMFPTAYFVYIVRDGRDVACSYREINARGIRSPYAPRLLNGVEEIAERWKANAEMAREAFDSLRWYHVCKLRFEDLILDTEKSLRRLCYQLEERYDSSMLNYHVVNRERGLVPEEFLQWKEKTLQPPMQSVVARYQWDLSAQEIGTFEEVAGHVLRRYGYL